MYELKIIQFKIDCQDGGHFINGDHIYNISTLTANLDGMLDAHFVYPKPLNKIILENCLHKFKLHSSNSKWKQILCYDLYIASHL